MTCWALLTQDPTTSHLPKGVAVATGYEFFRYTDAAGKWRWRVLSSGNRKVIADSGEGYDSLSNCDRAIALVKIVAPTARPT